MALYCLFCLSICLFSYNIAQTVQEEIEYECVDMYKQPAFQHPLMKNHQIQMRPSAEFQAMLSMESETSNLSTGLSEERCPKGQVPIHRPQVNYTNSFVRSKKKITEANLQAGPALNPSWPSSSLRPSFPLTIISALIIQKIYAIIRPFENYTMTWGGAQAVFDIYKPQVLQNQFSKAWIWLNHREKYVISSIQFGWAVHRGIYPDDRPRLTTYSISHRQRNGCYNALCVGGYVQVHKTIYPGMVYEQVSVLGRKQYSTHLLVAQDTRTKNWLLMSKSTLIGYWPYQIHSMEGVTQVYFGGYAGGPPGAVSPPMGAGNFPREARYNSKGSCFMKELKCFEGKRLIDIASNYFEEYVNSPKCYDVWFRKFEVGRGEMLTLGGPGGNCGL